MLTDNPNPTQRTPNKYKGFYVVITLKQKRISAKGEGKVAGGGGAEVDVGGMGWCKKGDLLFSTMFVVSHELILFCLCHSIVLNLLRIQK